MAGAPMIEHGMVEQDFKDLADAGVKLLGEVGLGTVKDGKTAKQMVDCARKYGIHHRPVAARLRLADHRRLPATAHDVPVQLYEQNPDGQSPD
jgi:hypothetical protein